MTRPRKIALGVGASAALLLTLLIVTPLLFKDQIADRVKSALNESVNARVEWSGLGLTLFRNFPNLTLRMDDLSVVGTGAFEGDTLVSMDQLHLVLDLPSVVRYWRRGDPLLVRAVALREPRLQMRVHEDGTANWDIMRKAESTGADTTASPGVAVSLRQMRIEDAEQRVDSATDAAREQARAEADSVIAEAERQAQAIREDARRVAEQVWAEANARADSLVARAAAQLAADRLRREADARAAQVVAEADRRAEALVEEARRKGGEGG